MLKYIYISLVKVEGSTEPPPKRVRQVIQTNSELPYIMYTASEITANLYCNCVYLYWEGCGVYSMSKKSCPNLYTGCLRNYRKSVL